MEFIFKLNLNDSFINFIHFYWINYLYLTVVFLFIFVLIFIINNASYLMIFKVTTIAIFFIYYIEISSSCSLINKNFTILNFSQNNYNIFLFNNLNKYHPFFFYLNFLLVFLLIQLLYQIRALNAIFLQ